MNKRPQVHELERSRRALETEAQSLKEQTQELEDELTEAENARLRLEVTLQALRAQFEREISTKEEKGEEKRRALNKQVEWSSVGMTSYLILNTISDLKSDLVYFFSALELQFQSFSLVVCRYASWK